MDIKERGRSSTSQGCRDWHWKCKHSQGCWAISSLRRLPCQILNLLRLCELIFIFMHHFLLKSSNEWIVLSWLQSKNNFKSNNLIGEKKKAFFFKPRPLIAWKTCKSKQSARSHMSIRWGLKWRGHICLRETCQLAWERRDERYVGALWRSWPQSSTSPSWFDGVSVSSCTSLTLMAIVLSICRNFFCFSGEKTELDSDAKEHRDYFCLFNFTK